MDAREEISRWLALLVQLSNEAESDQINADIKFLMGVALQLTSVLANRNTYLAKQCRRNKPAIAKKAPQKGPQREKDTNSKDDAQGSDEGSQKQREELSSIQQGIRQADPSLADQHRAALNKAAKVIANSQRTARAANWPEDIAAQLWEVLVEASIAYELAAFDARADHSA